jgi:hypothetical protein
MAIDPRIAMGVQAPNLQTSLNLFQNTLNNIQNRKMNDQSMAQNELMNPLRVLRLPIKKTRIYNLLLIMHLHYEPFYSLEITWARLNLLRNALIF